MRVRTRLNLGSPKIDLTSEGIERITLRSGSGVPPPEIHRGRKDEERGQRESTELHHYKGIMITWDDVMAGFKSKLNTCIKTCFYYYSSIATHHLLRETILASRINTVLLVQNTLRELLEGYGNSPRNGRSVSQNSKRV